MLLRYKLAGLSLFLLFQIFTFKSLGNSGDLIVFVSDTTVLQISGTDTSEFSSSTDTLKHIKENKRLIAIALIVIGGPLGFHRIYLGSKPFVPIFYALTLGGGFGILPLLDLIALIKTKNLEQFENNPKVLMWLEE